MLQSQSQSRPVVALFCAVVDHWGDMGVCWRLVRQLLRHRLRVHWWIDDVAALRDFALEAFRQPGLTILPWHRAAPRPEDRAPLSRCAALIEAFSCGLSDAWWQCWTERPERPAIVLEHLCLAPWGAEVHGLASPHPRIAVTRRYCVPGFDPQTGGLLREPHLAMLDAWRDGAFACLPFLRRLYPWLEPTARRVSLFCYPDAPVEALLAALRTDTQPSVVFVAPGGPHQAITRATGISLTDTITTLDRLTLVPIPRLPQDDYDRLLWSCHLNWVRGEDSFVRAQLAQRPFVWSPYRRPDGAHRDFASAFRQRWGSLAVPITDCDPACQDVTAWQRALAIWPTWQAHCQRWDQYLRQLPELSATLLDMADLAIV